MISVFKTTVCSISQIQVLKPQLDKLFLFGKWNFDLEDCDKILRIDSNSVISDIVIKLLQDNGYDCIELAD
jgi:hypothetical protein